MFARSLLKRLQRKLSRTPAPDFRERERNAQIHRPHYAYGILKCADVAKLYGLKEVTICEFGVASGGGLKNMIRIADAVTEFTGVKFRIYGFDTGTGIPETSGYKDHPEIWSPGDYPLIEKDELLKTIDGKAELIFGDIQETIHPFIEQLSQAAPIGFLAIDVDVYTGTHHALKCLVHDDPCLYLPAVGLYFDDITVYFANRWCGELLAIEEFNEANTLRKIDHDRTVRHFHRPWFTKMFVCHVFDHPVRRELPSERVQKMKPGGNFPPGVLH